MNYLNNNLPSQTGFTTGPITTFNNDLKSLQHLGPKIRNIILSDIRNSRDIAELTRKIKCWTPTNCPCRLFINSIRHVVYIN